MEWLKALYVAATIFGFGVTIADVVGVFANIGEGDSDGDADIDTDIDSDVDTDVEGDADVDDGDGSESEGSLVAHDRRQGKSLVIRLLTTIRTVVYFSLGFGPVGWFATTQYSSLATTLLWSLPVGVFVAVATRGLRAFMKRDLSSTVTGTDLLMESGIVTVSIDPGKVGKVRISIGGVYVERFAKSVKSARLPAGAIVRVADVDDEYVYVESEQE